MISSDSPYIDPLAVMMINGSASTTGKTIELLVNYHIQTLANYTAKLTNSRWDTRCRRHPAALTHVQAHNYLDPGRIRDLPVTEEERATVRPAEPKGRPPNRGNARKGK